MNISIVMATCNGESHLAEQLESLSAQTRAPREVIVSDDDSTDGTFAMLERFAATAPFPVRLKRNRPRAGFQDNFLGAAAQATGEWIAFCDQDDRWAPDKLERCAARAIPPDVTLIAHQATLTDAQGQPLGPYRQGIRETRLMDPLAGAPWRLFTGFSMLVRRRVLEVLPATARFLGSDGRPAAHDRWVSFLGPTLGRTLVLAEPLVFYRQHAGNVHGVRRRSPLNGAWRRPGAEVHYAALASRRMAELVEEMPHWTEESFPGFDRTRAGTLYRAVAAYFEARDALQAAAWGRRPGLWLAMLSTGQYRLATADRPQWQAAARDIVHALLPSRSAGPG